MKKQEAAITVEVLLEAGYEQALMGMSASFKDTSTPRKEWWTDEVRCRASIRAPKLAFKGGGHNKFLEHIELWLWVRSSRDFWQEADTYRLASKQSESTMHVLDKRNLTQDDFAVPILPAQLRYLNVLINNKEFYTLKKNLPEGFLQAREWKMSYKTLQNIVAQRAKHRLPEWQSFCEQILAQIEHPEFIVKEQECPKTMAALKRGYFEG